MIKTIAIAYFATSAIFFALFCVALLSMLNQAAACGYTFPKQKQDPCRRFLAGVLCILFFCVPILRGIVSINTAIAAVLGINTDSEMFGRIWDGFLKDAQYQR